MRMAKLKTLTEEKFTKLYEEIPVVILSKELDIDENPIMKRAKKYGLHKKFGSVQKTPYLCTRFAKMCNKSLYFEVPFRYTGFNKSKKTDAQQY